MDLFGADEDADKADSPSGQPAGPKPVDKSAPLAERMRPRTIDEVLGQAHLLGPGKVLRRAIEQDEVRSVIFWGCPLLPSCAADQPPRGMHRGPRMTKKKNPIC